MPKKEPSVVDVLKRMRTLLRKGWTQEYYAADEHGEFVGSDDKTAVAFCLVGARMRAVDELKANELRAPAKLLVQRCLPRGFKRSFSGDDPAVRFNDVEGRTKAEVLAVVNCAIKKAEARNAPARIAGHNNR